MESHGTTENHGRGCHNRLPSIEFSILGESSRDSLHNGIEPITIGGEDRRSGNSDWQLESIKDTNFGKILERLESLERHHLNYIHSHQAQLEARLGESKQSEEEFLEEANQIKNDIYSLICQQENDGNIKP